MHRNFENTATGTSEQGGNIRSRLFHISRGRTRCTAHCHKRAQLDMHRKFEDAATDMSEQGGKHTIKPLHISRVGPGVQIFLCVPQPPCISLMDALHCKPVANTAKSSSGTPTVVVTPSPSDRSRFTPISSLKTKI